MSAFRNCLVRVGRVVVATVALACGGDPAAPVTPASLVVSSGNNQSATVGAALGAPLAVVVTGSDGKPFAGANVAWSVTSGSATLTAPTSSSNASGVATIEATLGKTPGAVQVRAAVEGIGAPATFTITALAGAPAALTAFGGSGQSGTVGTVLPQPLILQVKDVHGNPVPNAAVTFSTAAGGSLSPAQATTDAQGLAQASFTLGTSAGSQTVVASVAGALTATFFATAVAGPPASLQALSGDLQEAVRSTALEHPLIAQVKDVHGNPVTGVAVSFTPPSGGSATPQQVTTDAQGRAATAVILGPQIGSQSVTASVAGGPSFTFTLRGIDPCNAWTSYTYGATLGGALTTVDCRLDSGEYVDTYGYSTQATASTFSVSTSSFDADLYLFTRGSTSDMVAEAEGAGAPSIKVLSAAGNYYAVVTSQLPGSVGTYSLSSSAANANVSGCERVFATRGIQTTQWVTTSDCNDSGYNSDQFWVYVPPGRTIIVTQLSGMFDSYLTLFDEAGTVVAFDDDSAGGQDARITFTATLGGFYIIDAGTFAQGAGGSYTLTIQ